MTRSLKTLAAATLVFFVAVTAAWADRPQREPLLSEGFDLPGICSFPVSVEITANKEFVAFFSDGRLLVTGKLFARLTNLDTGKTLDLNISGPAFIDPDSERIAGRGLFILFPEDVDGPGLVLTTGRLDIIRGEDGFVDQFELRGRSVDVCAALA